MIKIENVVLPSPEQWKTIIMGARNPMNSWNKSDSIKCDVAADCYRVCKDNMAGICIGPNDRGLMMRLAKAGTDHRKFMRMITVYVDMTAPLYWWKEFDTYKVGVAPHPSDIEVNSCSTMHKVHAKEFTLEDFSHEHLAPRSLVHLKLDIKELNIWRDIYLNGYPAENGNPEIKPKDKNSWWQMIQLLPSSYNQKRTVMMNYEVLANIYHSRKNHKLDEWRYFCDWIKTLPYSEIITGEDV